MSRSAPEGFYPVSCSAHDLEELGAATDTFLVVLLGLGGDLEGSVLSLDAFIGVLLEDVE